MLDKLQNLKQIGWQDNNKKERLKSLFFHLINKNLINKNLILKGGSMEKNKNLSIYLAFIVAH